MRTFIRAALASLLSLVVLAGPVSAATSQAITVAQATQTGTITGHVAGDTGAAIANAQVIIDGSGQHQSLATDGSGNFTATLPPGLYTITVVKGGYQTGSSDVTVAADTSVSVDVALTQASLSNLNVIGRTSSSAGAAAKFDISSTPTQTLTQDQILERDTPDLTSVLQELPGVTIPRATSNPNQSFIVRGMRFETKTTLDGHPVSSGTLGSFLTNYMASGIFSSVDVTKGAGLTGPLGGESGIGTVNLHTPDFGPNGAYVQGGFDNYNGTTYNIIAKVNFLKDDKLSFVFGRTFDGYRGPTYGLNEPNFTGATPALGTFSPPSGLANDIISYDTDFSDTYSLNAELAKMRYKFSDATSLSFEFLGLQGRFDPQGGAYGQFLGYANVPQCLNGSSPTASSYSVGANGAGCGPASEYNSPAAGALGLVNAGNTPLYAFFPGSDVRQNAPNFNA
ncbi:MAG TPA: TonB-dependent receptor, partial [Candidatus Acidoferrum sp.]|nr:TonB-dependent receptor [Candidatus Acidoferrum sp.]